MQWIEFLAILLLFGLIIKIKQWNIPNFNAYIQSLLMTNISRETVRFYLSKKYSALFIFISLLTYLKKFFVVYDIL